MGPYSLFLIWLWDCTFPNACLLVLFPLLCGSSAHILCLLNYRILSIFPINLYKVFTGWRYWLLFWLLQFFFHSAVDCVIEVLLHDFVSALPWSILISKKVAVAFFFPGKFTLRKFFFIHRCGKYSLLFSSGFSPSNSLLLVCDSWMSMELN